MTMIRLASALWIAWAVVVWNVVFDQVIVLAGRRYVIAALAASAGGPYARIDDWMRPAVPRAFWMATAAAGAILTVGLLAVRFAARVSRDSSPAGDPCVPQPTR